MDAEWSLRAARATDTEAILVVHVAAIIAYGPSAYTDKQVAAWAAKTDGIARYEAAIEDESTDLVVAESDGRVIGFGELDVQAGAVAAVFVDPDHTGEGVGSAILHRFEQRVQEEALDVIRLRAVRNAIGFYECHGDERRERVTTTTTNGVQVESVWMEKAL